MATQVVRTLSQAAIVSCVCWVPSIWLLTASVFISGAVKSVEAARPHLVSKNIFPTGGHAGTSIDVELAAAAEIANKDSHIKLVKIHCRSPTVISPRDIAILEETRQAQATVDVGRESEEIGGGWMTFVGVGSWANQACGLGLQGLVTDEDLDRLVEFYVSRGVEPRIEVCPFVDETLITGLSRRGFRLREFENALTRELPPNEDLRAVHPNGWPEGLVLVHVDPTDDVQVSTFAEMSTQGFRAAGEPLSDVYKVTTTKTVRHPRCDSFLARFQGTDVGGGGMESSDQVAYLFGTSVARTHRRKGIQAALILRRLELARERGCSIAVIHSQPGLPTERNALRMGFIPGYTKVVLTMSGSGLEPSP